MKIRSIVALVRDVSPSIARCELTHVERVPIVLERAVAQHGAYVDLLEELGCTIERIEALPDAPDAVFVEDTAIVLPGLAIVTRPGAPSRRAETESAAVALGRHRPLAFISAPGTIDGGDVLIQGNVIHVGSSSRSNAHGMAQLRALVEPFGYEVRAVTLRDCLHLKSAACFAPGGLLLHNPAWVDPGGFDFAGCLAVDPGEPAAANLLVVHSTVVMDSAHTATVQSLRDRGFEVRTVDLSELAKAEGAVTCCSVMVDR